MDDKIISNFNSLINGIINKPKPSIKTDQKIWSEIEDSILKEAYNTFQNASKKWKKVANHLKGKTPKQCYSRYRQINPNFKQGVWTKFEEEKWLASGLKIGQISASGPVMKFNVI